MAVVVSAEIVVVGFAETVVGVFAETVFVVADLAETSAAFAETVVVVVDLVETVGVVFAETDLVEAAAVVEPVGTAVVVKHAETEDEHHFPCLILSE